MKWHRIKAVYKRYTYNIFTLDHLTELFFWPLLDIFIWGITIVWIQKMDTQVSLVLPILTSLVLWQVVWRSNYEVSVNILKELWARNYVNLFSTPLKTSEWIVSLMLLGLTKNGITIIFGSISVYILYGANIFELGLPFIPYLLSLVISGWWCGFLSSSVIIYFGQRMQMFAWIAGYIFSPFSAVFYPLSALPSWAQPISKILPMSYVFEGVRSCYFNGLFSVELFVKSLVLNLIYLIGSLLLFVVMFEKSREKGLARLE